MVEAVTSPVEDAFRGRAARDRTGGRAVKTEQNPMRKRNDAGPTSAVSIESQRELALDLRWSWHHGTDALWRDLDPELWALTRNPWVVLQAASPTRVDEILADSAFRARMERLLARPRDYHASAAWLQQTHPRAPLTRVTYFSMEFALSEALPIYAGRLGNVVGDQSKATSALAVPVIGVGLLHQQGYFRQVIAGDGSQEELYHDNDPAQLPITSARGKEAHGAVRRSSGPATRSGSPFGASRLGGSRSTCSTATIPPIRRPDAASSVNCTEAAPRVRLRQELDSEG